MMETFANLEMLRSGKQLEIKCIINKFIKKIVEVTNKMYYYASTY